MLLVIICIILGFSLFVEKGKRIAAEMANSFFKFIIVILIIVIIIIIK